MRFLTIEIEEFGKLADFTLELGEGVNLVEGKNESGKSTLLAFLRFVLYNFPRRNAEGGDERDKRLSWRNRRAAGSLTLSHGGEIYRITRSFALRGSGTRETPIESHAVVRLSDGQKISLDGKTPGEYFLGLPAELYDSSLCLTQSDAARVASPAVREAVGDLLFSGESTLCAEGAEAKLQAARRDLQHMKGRGGRIAALEDELARLDAALAKAGEDAAALAALRTKSRALHATLDAQRAELAEVSASIERLGVDQTLALFDTYRNAAAEEAAAREQLNAAKERLAALPDATTALQIGDAIRAAEAARDEVARKAPEVARLETVRHDERLLNAAALVEREGGAPLLLGKHAKLCHGAKSCGIAAIILLLLAGLAALPAILLPQLALYCIAAAAALAVTSLVLFFAFLGKRRKAKNLVKDLDATNTAMLRTYLQQCERERDSNEAHNALLAALKAELDAAKENEQNALAHLRAALAVLGATEALTVEDARALLAELSERQSAARAAVDTARLAVGKASGARETLGNRLANEDEAALLARRDTLPAANASADRLQQRKAALQDAVRECERLCLETDRAESARAATANDTEALARERATVEAELAAARRRLAAIGMAITALSEATEDLRRGITPRLREDASKIFAELTEGAYDGLVLGNDFSISLAACGEPLPLSRFSAGCRDAAHLSLRLALLKTLSDERLPLLFDEAFSRLDDERARALLSILQGYARAGGQVLLFTCHSRERNMLAGDTTVKSVILA